METDLYFMLARIEEKLDELLKLEGYTINEDGSIINNEEEEENNTIKPNKYRE